MLFSKKQGLEGQGSSWNCPDHPIPVFFFASRNALSAAENSMSSSERAALRGPLRNHFEKRGGSQFWKCSGGFKSETGRIRFRVVRFQTPNSVRFLGLTEFRGANSVSSSQPIICVPKRTHRVFRRTHRVCRETQWVLFSETVLSKQYSARFLSNALNYDPSRALEGNAIKSSESVSGVVPDFSEMFPESPRRTGGMAHVCLKSEEPPKKARIVLSAEPLKSLETREKRTKKQGKLQNKKKQGKQKKQG